jgi:hypothetical protein
MIFLPLVFAHGSAYNTTRLSVLEGSTEAWAVVEGWGLIHTLDGEKWEWICEESLGVLGSYDVLAWAPGQAIAATSSGLLLVEECGKTLLSGLPEGDQVGLLLGQGDSFLVSSTGNESAGLYRCTLDGCSPVLVGVSPNRYFVRSLVQDGDLFYASVLYEESLASELWVGHDADFVQKAAWPAGDVDIRVLAASGQDLLLWQQTRSSSETPAMLVSHDGGSTFKKSIELGSYQDPIPTLAWIGEEIFLSSYLGRTWCSGNKGDDFTEVSSTAPLIRCSDSDGLGNLWLCTDHFSDGYDIATTRISESPRRFEPVACLDQVELAACQQTACGELYFTFITFGGTTAGICNQPPLSSEPPDTSCGCGSGADSLLLLFLPLYRRSRSRYPRPAIMPS